MVRAAEQGLRALRRPEDIALQRGKTVREVTGSRAGAASPASPAPAAVAEAPKPAAPAAAPRAPKPKAVDLTPADAPGSVAAEEE